MERKQEIIKKQAAELEAARAEIKMWRDGRNVISGHLIKRLHEQLAAEQAKNVGLREALENHSGNYKLSKEECTKINALLDAPSDTSALKAWLGKPVAWEFTDAFGTHYTDDQRDWMDTPGIESVTRLYSPKELK